MQGLINYARLDRITNSVSPYRGTLNRFPIHNRKHNQKCFFVREEDGRRVFDITYGNSWSSSPVTKEEYDIGIAQPHGNEKFRCFSETNNDYRSVIFSPHLLGTVRADNTFEFMCTNGYGQGDRLMLSEWMSWGWFTTDSRRGGLVWQSSRGAKRMMPIYKGLRVDCDTFKPTKPITVIGKKVNRKKGKELLKQYDHFYAVAGTMCKAMDYEIYLRTTDEVMREHNFTKTSLSKSPTLAEAEYYEVDFTKYFAAAEKLINSAPLDAMVLYVMALDIGRMNWNLRLFRQTGTTQTHHALDHNPHTMFLNLKRKLNKDIYKANESMFKPVEYTNEERFPPSEWGYKIIVDGQEVEQL